MLHSCHESRHGLQVSRVIGYSVSPGPAEGPVWSAGVVGLGELVELGLETDKAGGGGLSGEPPFQGLVEAFDLALGLRVVGVAVLLLDAERC